MSPRLVRHLVFVAAAVGALPGGRVACAQTTTTDGCLADVASGTISCTASDVLIASVSAEQVLDACDAFGDTATLELSVELLAGVTRYDVGVYIALDGGDALNGTCAISTVPTFPPPFLDLDADVCGDLSDSAPGTAPIGTVAVACADADADGFLDARACVAWDNVGANDCTGPLDTAPGTASKCNCSLVTIAGVPMPLGVRVQKDNDADGDGTFSDTEALSTLTVVPYRVTIFNDGNVAIVIDSITDDTHTIPSGSSCAALVGTTVAATSSVMCTFDGVVIDDNTNLTDTVTVEAHDLTAPRPGTAWDTSTVMAGNVLSSIAVTKTADPTNVPEPGGSVDYTVVVENTSATDPVTITAIADDAFGDVLTLGNCWEFDGVALAAGAMDSCTFTAMVAGSPADAHTNTVQVTATDDDGAEISDGDDAVVTFTDVASSIVVTKTADPTSVPESGGLVDYAVSVENTSATDTVTITAMSDDLFGDAFLLGDCSSLDGAALAPGATGSCTFTAIVSGSGGSMHTNTVSVTASDDDGDTAGDSDDAVVAFTFNDPDDDAGTVIDAAVDSGAAADASTAPDGHDGAVIDGSNGSDASDPSAIPPQGGGGEPGGGALVDAAMGGKRDGGDHDAGDGASAPGGCSCKLGPTNRPRTAWWGLLVFACVWTARRWPRARVEPRPRNAFSHRPDAPPRAAPRPSSSRRCSRGRARLARTS